MTDIIDFLERAGQDAQFRYASQDEIEQALSRAEIAPAMQKAVLAADQVQLANLLGTTSQCFPYEPGNGDQGEGDEDEETPSKEPDEASGHKLILS